ncbi:hypothetical protein Vadar_000529 [Vaccinium darrowii]|uniref:Uncharacterized protein n=1 Tax=Vaccinium darrowii TaxID=229202 RepID=A0ACB7X740_9ERIC|nr:hypothetical protein Vadar_000529 [Vaccinium darrowii]
MTQQLEITTMAAVHSFVCFILVILSIVVLIPTSSGLLTPDYYNKTCPGALDAVRSIVKQRIANEARYGASLLRLHFHDCFVNGCDGSVLLADTPTFTGEQSADPNIKSLRGFNVVAEIKAYLNFLCGGSVVSCADILAIAARDSINILGGPFYEVLLGRVDSLTASMDDANKDLPSSFSDFAGLLANFQSHGLDLQDLVALSGAHTIGLAKCSLYRPRIYGDTDINSNFAAGLKKVCPIDHGGSHRSPLDATTNIFDTVYYKELTQQKGLLHSDQELFSGGNRQSADLVEFYSNNQAAFWKDFAASMIKMGNLPPASSNGQVRLDCSVVNSPSPSPSPTSSPNLGTPTDNPSPPASVPNLAPPNTGTPTDNPSPPASAPNLAPNTGTPTDNPSPTASAPNLAPSNTGTPTTNNPSPPTSAPNV